MKSHVRENMAKNAIMNGIRLIPRDDGTAYAELSGLAWDLVSTMADDVKISNILYLPDKTWQADAEYHGKKCTCIDSGLGEVVITARDKVKELANE